VLYTFWTYTVSGLQFLFVEQMKFVSLAILLALVAASIATFHSPSARTRPKATYLAPLLLLVAVPLTVAIGVVFAAPSLGHPNRIGSWLLNSLDVVTLAFAIFCVYRAQGFRWFAAALAVAVLWIVLGVGFVAGMSVSGDWL
jgi:hypothetical protein